MEFPDSMNAGSTTLLKKDAKEYAVGKAARRRFSRATVSKVIFFIKKAEKAESMSKKAETKAIDLC